MNRTNLKSMCLIAGLLFAPIQASAQVWTVVAGTPWSLDATNAEKPGITDDVINEVAKRTGLKFEIKRQPYARVLQNLKDDTTDFALAFRTAAGEEYSRYPACIASIPTVVIARKGKSLKSFDDLYQLDRGIGGLRGVPYGDRYDKDPKIVRTEETDFPQMLKKMEAGRLDAVVGSIVMVLHNAREQKSENVLGERIALSTSELCLQVPLSKAELPTTKAVAQAMAAMAAEGMGATIIGKYVGADWQ